MIINCNSAINFQLLPYLQVYLYKMLCTRYQKHLLLIQDTVSSANPPSVFSFCWACRYWKAITASHFQAFLSERFSGSSGLKERRVKETNVAEKLQHHSWPGGPNNQRLSLLTWCPVYCRMCGVTGASTWTLLAVKPFVSSVLPLNVIAIIIATIMQNFHCIRCNIHSRSWFRSRYQR